MTKKEIPAVIRIIEKFLIFLAPKPPIIWTNYKRILDFVKKKFIKYASTRAISALTVVA